MKSLYNIFSGKEKYELVTQEEIVAKKNHPPEEDTTDPKEIKLKKNHPPEEVAMDPKEKLLNEIIELKINNFELHHLFDFFRKNDCENYKFVYALGWTCMKMNNVHNVHVMSKILTKKYSNEKNIYYSDCSTIIFVPAKGHSTRIGQLCCRLSDDRVNFINNINARDIFAELFYRLENNPELDVRNIVEFGKRKKECEMIYGRSFGFFQFFYDYFDYIFMLDFLFAFVIYGKNIEKMQITIDKYLLPSRHSFNTDRIQITTIDSENLIIVPKTYSRQISFGNSHNFILCHYYKKYEKELEKIDKYSRGAHGLH